MTGPSPSGALAATLADGLAAAGVTTLFGVPGGGANLDVIGAAAERGTAFVLMHGETAACIAASTWGRLAGAPGAAVVTRGPGFASAANGLAQATLDRAPLVLVSDVVPAASAARVAHQRLDQVAAAAPLARWSGVLGHAAPAAAVAGALRIAAGPPAGGVHLAFDPTAPGDVPPEPPSPEPAAPDAVDAAAAALAAARRPVVVVGVDAVAAGDVVRGAVRRLGCPVLTTYQAKGVVPESWDVAAGLFTAAAIERPLLDEADLVLGVGLDPVEPLPGPWTLAAPVVLLHAHPVETAYFGTPRLVVGPYAETLPRVLAGARPSWPAGAGARARAAGLTRLTAGRPRPAPGTLSPVELVTGVRAAAGDALLTVDAGAHMLAAMPLWTTEGPDPVLISNGLATMGFGLPAAIGAALARPGRRVVCLTGDGGLGMALAELETLARLELPVTVVVFNDRTLTLIALKQRGGQGGPAAVGYRRTDFAAVAAASGVPSKGVRDGAELAAALRARTGGPLLVDAHLDPGEYRHVARVVRGG